MNPNHFVDNQYHNDIRRAYKPLTAEEEKVLIIKAQAGSSRAQNKLVDSQLFQIISIAKMYVKTNPRNEMNDIIGVGVVGVPNKRGEYKNGFIQAIKDFDVTLDVRLISFALNYIRNAIRDYSQDNDLVRNSRQKSKSRENDPMHMADLEYEASIHGMDVDDYVAMMKARGEDVDTRVRAEKFGTVSFDAPIGNDDEKSTLLDVMPDEDTTIHEKTVSEDLKKMLDILEDNELKLLNAFYGLTQDKMTLQEIGTEMGGISRQAVSNKVEKVMSRLRQKAQREG